MVRQVTYVTTFIKPWEHHTESQSRNRKKKHVCGLKPKTSSLLLYMDNTQNFSTRCVYFKPIFRQ